MRLTVSWPKSGSRRLGGRMADERPRVGTRFPRRSGDWSREEVAQALVSDRDALVARLPLELARTSGLTRDQRELVVDEAIDFVVTEYSKPIHDREHLERAFWKAAGLRVKRMHEGRGATVRAGWKRVDLDGLEIAAGDGDPATALLRKLEVGVLLEFAAMLTQTQRDVLVCKYGGEREIGRRVIARRLSMPATEVRNAERAIARQLKAFVAVVSAGALCESRNESFAGLASGKLDGPSALAARIHLEHCPACRVGYAELLRSLQSGELQHRIAQLLPISITAEETRRQRGAPWDAWFDWISRPLASDSATTGVQLAAGARGLGTVAAAKLASLCIGGAVVVGGASYCVNAVLKEDPPRPTTAAKRPAIAEPPRVPGPRETVRPSAGSSVFKVKPEPKPTTRRTASRPAATARTATEHERSAPISPAATTSTGAPVQEFGPGPATTAPPAPAAAPSSGAPEFP